MAGTWALCTLHKMSYFVLMNHPASTDNCPWEVEEAPQGPDHKASNTYTHRSGKRLGHWSPRLCPQKV